MNIHFFSSKSYDRESFDRANTDPLITYTFHDVALQAPTAVLAHGANAVCVFVNDVVDEACLAVLAAQGIRVVALRCAGFNNVDITAATKHRIAVVRVPAYSPYAVAEHTIGLILCLNRKIHRAFNRIREGNFSLSGLIGFDLHGKTVGIIGTGRIGQVMVHICRGFGCHVLAYDPKPNDAITATGAQYTDLKTVLSHSDIISLHCPLTPETKHVINAEALSCMQPHVMLVNTSRGALVDTKAVIQALKVNRLSGFALDVYEEEAGLFFEDHSQGVVNDDLFMRLTTFPNVLITGHQAFLTHDALSAIAETTLSNVQHILTNSPCLNQVNPFS